MRRHATQPPRALAFVFVICGLALGTLGAASDTGTVELRLAHRTFRPEVEPPIAPSWFDAPAVERSALGRRYLVAVTRPAPGRDPRRDLEAAGAEPLGYLPGHGYRVRLRPESETAVRALPQVVWLGETPPWFKAPQELVETIEATRVPTSSGNEATLRVLLFAGEPAQRVRSEVASFEIHAAPAGKDDAWRIVARVPQQQLGRVVSRLAALPEVEAIEPVRRLEYLNQDAVWVHQSFVGPGSQQTPVFSHGIFGCSQIVGFADSGQDFDSCFFRDTVNGAPPISTCASAPCPPAAANFGQRKDILYYNWSGSPAGDGAACSALTGGGHGTHTSGSIAADNLPYANCTTFSTPARNGGDGQAPGAKLVAQEMGDGLEYLNNLGGTVWNLADVAFQTGARIHSNSWGGTCEDALGQCVPGCTLPYDSLARDADLAMWTHPDLLIVIAAGNSLSCPPPDAVTTPGTAKNVVTVGSVGHGTGANTPTSSSPGPVFDGRLKPTLAAQGESTVSSAADGSLGTNNCGTCSLSGTSMAAPTAAGLAALAREYYTAGFYTTGTRDAAQGITPSAALLKATLIDGAVALGAEAPGPGFEAGYGRILLGSTLAFADSSFRLRVDDHREGIGTGGVVTHAYDVGATTPLRATLVWTDYPAAIEAAVARVNELKLEVIDPSGQVWFQTLDPGSGAPQATSNPGDPHDAVNVEERLVFPTPTPGRWAFRVVGVDVPWGPQPFALVVRGDLTDCPAPPSPGAPSLSTPAENEVNVTWNGVSGGAAYNVYRSLGACPGGPWIPVAAAIDGTSFHDTGLSGGTPYSYRVTAASDATGRCESPPSSCASIVPTGDCTLGPDFRGVESATSAGLDACTVELEWDPAVSFCGGDVRYNVYRSTSPSFVPGPGNRIARCIAATGYTDSVDLSSGAPYSYVVRAEDATTGHGGPCRSGNEDANAATKAAVADGPPGFGTWSDDAGDTGTAKFVAASPWSNPMTGGNSGPRVYRVSSSAGACADLTTPALTLADPGQSPELTFFTRHELEYDPFGPLGAEGSVGQVEIANAPAFSDWTRVPLTPDYPEYVDFHFTNCTTTQDGTTYFTSFHPAFTSYSASLVNWGGGNIKLRFHLSGDFLYPSGNWWIDDVSVSQTVVPGACSTQSAGPPPVPDGAVVAGEPLRASRSGNDVAIDWDASRCPAAAVNVYHGTLGDFSTFAGGLCDLPATGSATVTLPDDAWFLVTATDGDATDGSWGRYLDGSERTYAGAGVACQEITAHVTNHGCP